MKVINGRRRMQFCTGAHIGEVVMLSLFIPRHFKKCAVICNTLHSKNCVPVSVCLYVRPSAHRFHSPGSIFLNQFSSKLAVRVDIGKECLGILKECCGIVDG